MIKTTKRILVFLVSVYFSLCAGLYLFQEYFIFQSTSLEQNFQFQFDAPFTEFNLKNKGVQLNALHFKVENPKGVLLYFHGNLGDLSRWGREVQALLKYQYDIVVMDYRGYGKSGGEPSELLMYEDADLFYQYLKGSFNEEEIIVYGRSLGSTFATYVASKNAPKKLILETPFYSLKSVVKEALPFLPIEYIVNYSFESYLFAPIVSCPVLVLLAKQDDVVAFENGLRLTDALDNKINVVVEGATHNDLTEYPVYWESLDAFLKE